MSLQACADIVAKGDPDRFAAAMAAPVAARKVLFPIYAFNVEVSRAPWMTSEPMIGEMRLQWWRDALEEMASGVPVRRHEVTIPLSGFFMVDQQGTDLLDKLIVARRWDLYTEPFEDNSHFDDYLDATGGGLMWAAARALGGTDELAFRQVGRASALANLFLAVPELEARGRKPLVDGKPDSVAALAKDALEGLEGIDVSQAGREATLAGWRARGILKRAAKQPARVGAGALVESEFRRRVSLMLARARLG